ncbi:hypothetical protein GJT83_00915 [Enterobacteriaceae endosymbiont of Plateumaris pusilla]|uniref:SPFH domain-containing protein n=1 Tax=Enterobacteriaceae endosymbiont of Plateumaris pusilla TaxID=2675795 RepID=UPI001448F113|nr:SPFH domain-containing protein [Enterobacteriaceae endosymbiont of Plateumaris pusilla]QJC29475.1 hypothetical protein GJT83_00915 [Enterobacteriaceae endosymbiont of Plateumaris pusilla]
MSKCLIYLLIIILNFLYLSIFIINEGYVGINSYNNIITIYKPGFHFKIPLFNNIQILNSSLFSTNFQINKFILKNKKDLIIHVYIIWKIKDYKLYYLNTGGNLIHTEIILKRQVSDKLYLDIDKLNIQKIFNHSSNFLKKSLSNYDNNQIKNIKENFISKLISQNNNQTIINNMNNMGIDIIDIKIEKVSFSKDILKNIFYNFNHKKIKTLK